MTHRRGGSTIACKAFVFFLTHYLLLTAHCVAAVPPLIHYQGRLTEANQAPLAGAHTVTIRIYDAETGGASLWQETHPITLTSQDRGIFSVLLGSLNSFGALTFNQPLWLSIEVDGEGEMSPRQRFTAVGYAINTDTLDGLRSDQFLRSNLLPTAGKIVQLDPSGALPAVSGANLMALNASALASGTVPQARLPSDVQSLSASGQPALVGDVTLAAGSNVTLSQSGQAITIAAAGAGASGNRATTTASAAVSIGIASDTDLLSVTITKSQAGSALLVLATVQLTHTGNPNSKLVDVKLFRGATPLDAGYRVRLGTANQAVSEVPVSLQTWDASGAGTYTFTLKARSSAAGATATVRRLTVVELL